MITSLSIQQVAEITGGELIGESTWLEIGKISIDSRQIITPGDTLFFALVGSKNNGETYIKELIDKGVNAFVVSKTFDAAAYPEAVFVVVEDTKKALQQLAYFVRNQFTKPVLAITGSNAKTTVKEWLGQVLSQDYNVGKSPKSYNSQVGVPLSVFGLRDYHNVAILEAGISSVGEMDKLEKIIKPDIGIFTNIGSAHDQGFESREQKILEKLRLFKSVQYLVFRNDNGLLSEVIIREIPSEKWISWSDQSGSVYRRSLKIGEDETRIILMKDDLNMNTFQVPFIGQASLENITHVIVAALSLGQNPSQIQSALSSLKPIDMRLTLKDGVNDSLIIDDTYNNDLEGLKVALDFLSQQRPKRRKLVILSDLLQVDEEKSIIEEVSELLIKHEIDGLFSVGKSLRKAQLPSTISHLAFDSTDELMKKVSHSDFQDDLILITGARDFGFEKVVDHLQKRVHGTTLEINLNSLTHNFNFYKTQLKPETKVMVMVKAFAYGGGAPEIANHLQSLGADYLAVAYTDEGVSLRKQGIHLPIMVLNPVKESLELCLEHDLEPVVFSNSFFRHVCDVAKKTQKSIKVHLDLDTGMKRLGFGKEDLDDLKGLIQANPQIVIQSMYTHLAGADEDIHADFSQAQIKDFLKMSDELQRVIPSKALRHVLNSAGIMAFPDSQMEMVRLGIGLYGVEVGGVKSGSLKSISTLKTTISQIKTLSPGETVGYSRAGQLLNGGNIATLAIGYADGYDRRFSKGVGEVSINGKLAPVVGNVCMDMCMVDVTGMDATEGDEVIIFGEEISLESLAEKMGTIPYEVLTNISTRVKRVYYLD